MRQDLLFLALLLLWLGLVFKLLEPFLTPILWSVVVAIVVYPLHRQLLRWLLPAWSALLVTSSLLFFWIIPILVLSVIVFQQLVEIGAQAIELFRAYRPSDLIAAIEHSRFYQENREALEPLVRFLQGPEFRNLLVNTVNTVVTFMGQQFRSVALTAGQNLFNLFVFLITLFFLLLQGERLLLRLEGLLPFPRADLRVLLATVYRTILAVVYGTLGTAFLQGILIALAFYAVGLAYPLVFGILAFFAAFIPPFGASMVWIPSAIYAFLRLGLSEGLFMTLWGALLVSSVDNVVRPLIMKRGVELPYVVLFFATIGGLINFGFVGLFLGPILFTTLLLFLEIYERRLPFRGSEARRSPQASDRSEASQGSGVCRRSAGPP